MSFAETCMSEPSSLQENTARIVVGILRIVTYHANIHLDVLAMIPVTVLLSDDLHNFIRRAVTDGLFDSMDDLMAHAVGLVRREAMLGRTQDSDSVSFVEPTPTPVPVPVTATVTSGSTPLEARPAVDLTRQGFDSPAFMGDLVGKIERKAAEERAAQKSSGLFPFKPR